MPRPPPPPSALTITPAPFCAARKARASSSVTASGLPAGRLAVVTHVGPYDELGAAWGRFMGWVASQGLSPDDRYGEIYVTEPTPDGDPNLLRSDLFLTLR